MCTLYDATFFESVNLYDATFFESVCVNGAHEAVHLNLVQDSITHATHVVQAAASCEGTGLGARRRDARIGLRLWAGL